MFCPAHTCDLCGNSFPSVIEKTEDGRRICDLCVESEAA